VGIAPEEDGVFDVEVEEKKIMRDVIFGISSRQKLAPLDHPAGARLKYAMAKEKQKATE
jgi:hypothetical protein